MSPVASAIRTNPAYARMMSYPPPFAPLKYASARSRSPVSSKYSPAQ